MKKFFTQKFLLSCIMTTIACIFGFNADVFMADAAPLPDAGLVQSGAEPSTEGIATETAGRAATADTNPDFYSKEIDKRITKIRPMATPIDQISRYADAGHSDSFEVKYYSVGTKPIRTTVKTQFTAMSTPSAKLIVDDPSIFTLDDTIRVVDIKGITSYDGTAYSAEDPHTPDLVLCVCGKADDGNPIVYAVNGNKEDGTGQAIWAPLIKAKTTLVRMGKACAEIDAQTGRFATLPTPEVQYCQNYMIQVEQSTFDKIAKKEVDWSFNDLEEDSIYDMRLTMEGSALFGSKNRITHTSKNGSAQWFTGGLWWQCGKDLEIGKWNEQTGQAEITDEELVDISKELFVGTGIGNKRKIIFAGSNMLAAFSRIKSEKFRLKDSVEVWNLKFKSWDTDFGELLVMHHELFDVNGMADYGMALDPTFLSKKTHVSWSRSVVDFKAAGVRNTQAAIIQEVSCLYLRYKKAHARMKLVGDPLKAAA